MKKFFIAVISLVIVMIVGYSIAYIITPVSSIQLEEYEHEISVMCEQAYIVRDETVYYAPGAGTVYNTAAEGERVSSNAVIGTVYNGSVSTAQLKELSTIDKRISLLKEYGAQSSLYSHDSSSAESAVSGKMHDIISLARENNIEQIHEYKNDINRLRRGEDVSLSGKISELEAEKSNIEAGMSSGKSEIISDRSGIFSSYIDGLEGILVPEKIQEYNAEYIRSLSSSESRTASGSPIALGDAACKVMNNHSWYVLGIIKSEYSPMFKDRSRVTVRFTNLSGSEASGNIQFISQPDINGECIVLVKVPSYIESAFSYRNIDADIVFEQYSGYKIPTEAVHTGETLNSYYVYAMQGSDTYICDCVVLYTDISEGYSIIKSSDDAENKLSSMERLIVGER